LSGRGNLAKRYELYELNKLNKPHVVIATLIPSPSMGED